jgi:REP element-mobilizing transposase RayT
MKHKKRNKTAVFIHYVWTTWDRAPLITQNIERDVYRLIEDEIKEADCKVIALNGVEDHVHVLVDLSPMVTIAGLVKQIKGVSSLRTNETLSVENEFKWQAGYGAFSVSRWDVKKIIRYIEMQKEHHGEGTWIDSLEPDD